MTKESTILHVSRRYGPVGGMERYVWELTSELAALGHDVQVLCEKLHADQAPTGVKAHELGVIKARPRWLSHLRFSRRVNRWLQAHPRQNRIIHSHERTGDHHITTFHGPPFAQVLDVPWFKRISVRAQMNLWLEKREVCAPQVCTVVPNSISIADMLKRYYPCISKRLTDPITPGVTQGPRRPSRRVRSDGGIVGFVGKEWRRKGLELAVKIISELRLMRPGLEFWVAGPAPDEIKHLFADLHGGIRLLGETDAARLYPQLDLLLHPARQEPYGMVITEAMAACVPVVISNRCGAAPEVGKDRGVVVDLDDHSASWVNACQTMLDIDLPDEGFSRSWAEVASEYEQLYLAINS